MYSLLMMAAMATTPDTTSFGWRFAGCTGCTGSASCYGTACYGSSCYGSACYGSSCYGSACYGSSCYGSACYGSSCCGGGVLFPRLRGLFAGLGCRGASCYGAACYGSSCYGSSCHGAVYYGVGCYGSSCYGSSCHGCVGSACYGSVISYPMSTGCTGCTGMIVGSSVPAMPVYGATALEGTSSILSAQAPVEPAKAIATLQLELPAKATLSVDGQVIAGDGVTRSFHTPELTVGQTYYYDFKAEVLVDGKPQVEEKRIIVKAGDKLNESFTKLIAAAKASSDAVASK